MIDSSLEYRSYYKQYVLNAVYSHDENKIYTALRTISNMILVETIPLIDLIISNSSYSRDLRDYANEIKNRLNQYVAIN